MNMNKSFTKKDIKAKVLTDWNHFNCKFLPDQLVKVNNDIAYWESKRLQSFAGQVGKVFAATTKMVNVCVMVLVDNQPVTMLSLVMVKLVVSIL